MSSDRDLIHKDLVITFVNQITYQTNTGILSANYDLMASRMNPTECLLIAIMTAGWGANGQVTLRLQDALTSGGAFATRGTMVCTRASGNRTFIGQISNPRRFVRLSYDVTGNACTLSVIGIFTRSRKEPITQLPTTGLPTVTEVVP